MIAGYLLSGVPPAALGQSLVPLKDQPQELLLPPGIGRDDAELSAQAVHLWTEAGGVQVLQCSGDFRFTLGNRRLRAREAVIWMTPQEHQGTSYQYFEVFLWQAAEIIDPGGAATRAPALFVTTATSGAIRLQADKWARAQPRNARLYSDAQRVRAELSPAVHAAGPAETVTPPGRQLRLPRGPDRPLQREFSARDTRSQVIRGELVFTAIGEFYFSQGIAGAPDFMEAQALAAVLFTRRPDEQGPPADPEADRPELGEVRGIYLEGDVLLTQGAHQLRGQRVYYDLENSRALLLEPVLRIVLEDRRIPLYVRAAEARQLSRTEFTAVDARISSSEFHTPHYHIGAGRVYLATESAVGGADGIPGTRAGSYRIDDATFNVGDVPIFYWPSAQGNFQEGESALRSVRVGGDDRFGFSLETTWNLFTLAGRDKPEAFKEALLDLDILGDRGVGFGLRTRYQSDHSYGLFRGYYIYDDAEQDDLSEFRDPKIEHPNRGRATVRHRWFLPDDWELTAEGSYISDKNFLEQYFENEFDTDKDQETYFQLKQQRDNWALSILAQVRILNWLTQTESLPDVAFRLVGEPIGPATLFSENRAGRVRYRPDERRVSISAANNPGNDVRSGWVNRADTRQELTAPLTVGPVQLAPFASGRLSWWDDTPHGGGLDRTFGSAGVRGSMYLSKVIEDLNSKFWDLQGLRHVVKVDAAAWVAGSNRSSGDLFPFEQPVEGIEDFSGATVGVRQRLQTRRGPADARRTVDWITLDLEAAYFSDNVDRFNGFASMTRPEESIATNHIRGNLIWRLSDTTALLSDANYNLDRGKLDIVDLSVAVERSPRLSYFVGWRRIDDTDSNLFGFGGNYQIDEKHTIGMRNYFDLDRGSTESVDFAIIRRFPRWYVSLTFELDQFQDNTSVSLALWPEGYPNVGLGSKRYTGLATSTAIETSN